MRRLMTRDGLLFFESGALLALVRPALLLIPFRTLLAFVGRASVKPGRQPSAAEIERVRWAVSAASRFVPGGRHCLTRALVAKLLFGRRGRGVDLRIGVAKDKAGLLIAHAWLESGGAPIFGATDEDLRHYSSLPQLNRA